MPIFECYGEVINLERSKIPYVNIMTIKCECGEVKMSIHDDVLTFKSGDKLKLVIDNALPAFKENDFCGVLHLVKREGDLVIASIGGFVVTFKGCEVPLSLNERYYICLLHV